MMHSLGRKTDRIPWVPMYATRVRARDAQESYTKARRKLSFCAYVHNNLLHSRR